LGVALLVAARLHADTNRERPWRWAAAGLAFGAAYWVRAAGLFLVLGLAILVIRHLAAAHRLSAKGYSVAVSVAGAAVLAGIARNILLVGTWQGTIDKRFSNPVRSLLVETVRAGKVLVLGPTFDMPEWTSIPRALFIALFLGGMACLAWSYVRHGHRPVPAAPSPPTPPCFSQFGGSMRQFLGEFCPALNAIGVDLLILVLIYCGCMFYAGLTTAISYDARMFLPLIPLLMLLLGVALRALLSAPARQSISHRLALFALGGSFCCYVILNIVMDVRPPTDYAPPSVAGILDSPSVEGRTARAAVLELVDPSRVVVANYGQTVGYALGRPTVSLVDQSFSALEWNEQAVHDVVDRYDAAAIVIYVNKLFMPSAFVRQLAQGQAPSWVKLTYRSSEFLVYEPLSRRAKSNGSFPISQRPVLRDKTFNQ
jgi:hypothetical protein